MQDFDSDRPSGGTLLARRHRRATTSGVANDPAGSDQGQLPGLREADVLAGIARGGLTDCTACGVCNAVCPTYLVRQDERDGPRGRIALMQALSTSGEAERSEVGRDVRPYLDQCLSCGACEAACPEGVEFGAALMASRALSAETGVAKAERRLRRILGQALAQPDSQTQALKLAGLTRPLRSALTAAGLKRLADPLAGPLGRAARLEAAGAEFSGPGTAYTEAERRGRVIIFPGCTARSLRPGVNDASIRLLARQGFDVVVPSGGGCCGALADQLGHAGEAGALRQANVQAVTKARSKLQDGDEHVAVDAVLSTSPQCARAISISFISKGGFEPLGPAPSVDRDLVVGATDVLEFLSVTDFGAPQRWSALRIGVMGHCQRPRRENFSSAGTSDLNQPAVVRGEAVAGAGGGAGGSALGGAGSGGSGTARGGADTRQPGHYSPQDTARLLTDAGYTVVPISQAGLCCGGAGVYPYLSPEFSAELRSAFLKTVRSQDIDILAVEDVGCFAALADHAAVPAIHAIELLDWAYGGPVPQGLERFKAFVTDVPVAEPQVYPEGYDAEDGRDF